MKTNETILCETYKDLERQIKDLQDLQKAVRVELEATLKAQNAETLEIDGYIISNKETTSMRLSTTEIKKNNPLQYAELMNAFGKEVTSHRFSIKEK